MNLHTYQMVEERRRELILEAMQIRMAKEAQEAEKKQKANDQRHEEEYHALPRTA